MHHVIVSKDYNTERSEIICTLFTCLPRLFSLTIDLGYGSAELTDIYQLIFSLPKLRYLKCSANNTDSSIPFPLALTTPLSTIEHLVIHHSASFHELSALLFYTPQLHRLKFSHTDDSEQTSGSLSPRRLSHLTYISFDVPYITFDDFEMFITSLDCQV